MKKFLLSLLCTMCMISANARIEMKMAAISGNEKMELRKSMQKAAPVKHEATYLTGIAAPRHYAKAPRRVSGQAVFYFDMIETVLNEIEGHDAFYTSAPVTITRLEEPVKVVNQLSEVEEECNTLLENIYDGYGQEVYANYNAEESTLYVPAQIIYTHQTYGQFVNVGYPTDPEAEEWIAGTYYNVVEEEETHSLSIVPNDEINDRAVILMVDYLDEQGAPYVWSFYSTDNASYHQPTHTMYYATRSVNEEGTAFLDWETEQQCPVYVEDLGDALYFHNFHSDYYYGALNTMFVANVTGEDTFEVPFPQLFLVTNMNGSVTELTFCDYRETESNPDGFKNGVIINGNNYIFGQLNEENNIDPIVMFMSPDRGSRWFGIIDGYIQIINTPIDPEGVNTVLAPVAKSEATFNLQGQRVNAAQQGVVVRNGQKTLVK